MSNSPTKVIRTVPNIGGSSTLRTLNTSSHTTESANKTLSRSLIKSLINIPCMQINFYPNNKKNVNTLNKNINKKRKEISAPKLKAKLI